MMLKATFIILLAQLVLCGCKGPKGDQGPAGAAGLKGDTGPSGPGTRKVYQGVVPNQAIFIKSVPEVTLTTTMSAISVYVNDAKNGFPTLWSELGDIYSANLSTDPYFSSSFGQIALINCEGNSFIIVVVT